jgi:transcription initiation factor IIF auxiliary subunit
MEESNKEIMELFKNRLNFSKANNTEAKKLIDDDKQLYNNFQIEKIEDKEGIDIENDFSLLKKDLLKYVNGARNMFDNSLFDKSNEVNHKKNNNKPNIQKEYENSQESLTEHPFKQQGINSLDDNLKKKIEENNKNRYSSLDYKSFKPDMWVSENESSMNGGKLDPSSNISAFDSMESYDYILD